MARGFSLAELMIALAILGIGLLIIGAALPIGVRYTQQSVNMTSGQAAAEYALDTFEQNAALRDTILDAAGALIREPGLFQPRDPTAGKLGRFDSSYEPLIKVRSAFGQNILAQSGTTGYGEEFFVPGTGSPDQYRKVVLAEQAVRTWLLNTFADSPKECDKDPSVAPLGPWLRPAIASASVVYPPIAPDTAFLASAFLQNPSVTEYTRAQLTPSERKKVLDKRIVWTAFYRRVGYGSGSDPALYEVIAVAAWLPSANHRFPLQDPSNGGSGGTVESPGGRSGTGYLANHDCLAPVPWLVTFDPNPPALPAPPGSPPFDTNGFPNMGTPPVPQPATLTFRCKPSYDGLFPVGTIFIPARNDQAPNLVPSVANRVGFGPPAPTNLPIYEVVGRPDETTVTVKYNGYYPRKGQTTPLAAEWPVWVIPPAIQEVVPGNPPTPVFDKHSPILAVVRRYVHLREIP